ncbi:MAG TPA: rhodanese-like domain-containing protein [Thermomicrobiales bacterium]|nr:rhodanese-like domain-containing protein [Thermomicrobiales bacterium]
MRDRHELPQGHITRRRAIGFAATLVAGSMLGTARSAARQGTPDPPVPQRDSTTHAAALVDVDWLMANRTDPSTRVVGLMPADEFEAAHIPGSTQVDWPELELVDTSDASVANWRTETERRLKGLGIAPGDTVVAYDNDTLFAARLWWVLRYLGHADVHVLDGGLAAWQEAGEPAQAGPSPETDLALAAHGGTPNQAALAQLDEVMGWLGDSDVVIVDARTPDEYAAGHIPGAVNINYPLNAEPSSPHYWKSAGVLRAMYLEAGVTPDRLIVPYCSSGVRSAVTAFTLHHLGYERVALYTGSWQEWESVPTTPRTTGSQP